jgi:hypothetical protein
MSLDFERSVLSQSSCCLCNDVSSPLGDILIVFNLPWNRRAFPFQRRPSSVVLLNLDVSLMEILGNPYTFCGRDSYIYQTLSFSCWTNIQTTSPSFPGSSGWPYHWGPLARWYLPLPSLLHKNFSFMIFCSLLLNEEDSDSQKEERFRNEMNLEASSQE